MDQTQLNALIAAGYAQAAARLGAAYAIFRPTGALEPLSATAIASVMAVFDPSITSALTGIDDRKGSAATMIGDFSIIAPGDYLVGDDTWFVSHIEPLRAAECIRCNQTVSIAVPQAAFTTGSASYGGRLPSTDTVVATGWPANLQLKSHLEAPAARLPADARSAIAELLLPAIPGVAIAHGHMLTTAFGQTYVVAAAELSDTGWRLEAVLQTT